MKKLLNISLQFIELISLIISLAIIALIIIGLIFASFSHAQGWWNSFETTPFYAIVNHRSVEITSPDTLWLIVEAETTFVAFPADTFIVGSVSEENRPWMNYVYLGLSIAAVPPFLDSLKIVRFRPEDGIYIKPNETIPAKWIVQHDKILFMKKDEYR